MHASSPAEILNLLLIVTLVPVTVVTARKLTHPGSVWMAAGFILIATAGVLAVVENVAPVLAISAVKELCVPAAGISYTVGLWKLHIAIRRRVVL